MATNELLPFANGEDANVLPTAQWQALTDILENGFQSGIAKSEQVNRVLAQGAVASYVLGQLIVDQLNKDATLDKDTLYQNIVTALQENAKDVCLPLAGGTMSEDAKIGFASYPNIKVGSDGVSVFIGNNGAKGSLARFFDVDFESNPGGLQVRVADGTTSKYMFLKTDGTFQWDEHQVERVNSSGTAWIRYENGLQIVFDDYNVEANSKGGQVKNFPVAFKDNNYAISVTDINSSATFVSPYLNFLVYNKTTTGFKLALSQSVSTADAFNFIAIGWWK